MGRPGAGAAKKGVRHHATLATSDCLGSAPWHKSGILASHTGSCWGGIKSHYVIYRMYNRLQMGNHLRGHLSSENLHLCIINRSIQLTTVSASDQTKQNAREQVTNALTQRRFANFTVPPAHLFPHKKEPTPIPSQEGPHPLPSQRD